MTFTHALSTNRYGEADLIVSTSAANGTHTTLASAMSAAVSGQTIFLRDSVTENVTITPGVNISAWAGGALNTPTIIGTLTMTGAGTSTISGIRLQTNSAALIAVTGSANSRLLLDDCYLNMTNNTGITFSTSGTTSQIQLSSCRGDLGTTGIAIFSHSSAGNLSIVNTIINNSGASSTANTCSAGTLTLISQTFLPNPITMSGTGAFTGKFFEIDTSATNVTCLTTVSGTTNLVQFGRLSSGTATPLSVGGTVNSDAIILNHSNATAISGAGTLVYNSIFQDATVGALTTTTLTPKGHVGMQNSTAPAAGYIGEQIRAQVATGSAVTLTSATPKTVTSINLTAGIWDISSLCGFSGATTATQVRSAIGTTTNSLAGTVPGDSGADAPVTGFANSDIILAIPSFRVSLSTTTTYYLIAQCTFTVGTGTAYGRISGTRVA